LNLFRMIKTDFHLLVAGIAGITLGCL
jgi:hypothetical protein